MPPNVGHAASQNDFCHCNCHVVHHIDDPSTLSPENLRWELDQHTHVLQKLREQYALVDAERLKLATELSKHSNHPHERLPHKRSEPIDSQLVRPAFERHGYDDPPGDEIIGIVSDINSQILNIAGKVAEEIVEAFPQNSAKDPNRKVKLDIVNELMDVVGAKMVNILLKSDFMRDPTPVQLAIQSMLANGICTILQWWPMSPAQSFGRDFWSLYKRIQKSEVQPVASRWRALGSKYYRQSGLVDLRGFAVDGFLNLISKILVVSGVYPLISELDNRPIEFVRTCVGQNVKVMWDTADAFAQKIRERVHSTDYQLMFAAPGEVFDSSVMRAQGTQSPPPTAKRGDKGRKEKGEDNAWLVLCTTDLGLQRTTNMGKPGERNPDLLVEVMNKAVVIFEYELEGM